MSQKLEDYIQSSNPLLLVKTPEPERAITKLVTSLSKIKLMVNGNPTPSSYNTYVWGIHSGVRKITMEGKTQKTATEAVEGTAGNPAGCLKFLEAAPDNTILFVKGYHPYLTEKYKDQVAVIEKIRDLIRPCNATNKALVFVSPDFNIPKELSKDITPVDFSLPDKAEIQSVLRMVCQCNEAVMPSGKELDAILDAAMGMTAQEAENAFSLSLVVSKKFDENLIRKEKAIIVKKSEVLEVVDSAESLDTIAGMENAKVWAELKKDCFTPEAKAFGVVPPKGILLIGVPGCGKSLFAKALANIFKRPLLRMDMASVKDKWVGGSEGRMKEALSMSEAVSPCVLWIDEIEKAFGGAGSEDAHEVTTSIFGMLLTWMVEKKGDVILVATANNIKALRPELISRFSTQFWVGLPDSVQRLDAIKIHLKKNGRPANLFTDAQLAEAIGLTKGFSGREIEAAVQDSINRAWHQKHSQVQVEDLVEAVKNIRPASKVKAAEIEALIRAKEQMGVLDASINHDPVTSTSEGSRKINKGVAG